MKTYKILKTSEKKMINYKIKLNTQKNAHENIEAKI